MIEGANERGRKRARERERERERARARARARERERERAMGISVLFRLYRRMDGWLWDEQRRFSDFAGTLHSLS